MSRSLKEEGNMQISEGVFWNRYLIREFDRPSKNGSKIPLATRLHLLLTNFNLDLHLDLFPSFVWCDWCIKQRKPQIIIVEWFEIFEKINICPMWTCNSGVNSFFLQMNNICWVTWQSWYQMDSMCTDDLVESTYWQFFWEEGLSGISHSSVSTSSIRQSGETFYLHQKLGDFWVISLEAKRKSCKLLY